MNPDWIAFLKSNGAIVSVDQQIEFPNTNHEMTDKIYPVTHLDVFEVSGAGAATFLQGQLTCNINDLLENKASPAAFCNAKGRVISTLLIIKKADTFLIVLPRTLLDKVIKKLSMYILRADVQMTHKSDELCLLGINCSSSDLHGMEMPKEPYAVSITEPRSIRLPGTLSRYLLVSSTDKAINFWKQALNLENLQPSDSKEWIYQDLSSGLPWFNEAQSEQYIPQMLNIDKLGGISFNKGCYTGQEIVARTHYLGKAKREMFLAECSQTAIIEDDTAIINSVHNEQAGKILSFQNYKQKCRLLLVMQSVDSDLKCLMLNNSSQDKIHIIPFQ